MAEDAEKKLTVNSVKTLMHNAGWCWFQDPRAIIKDGKLVIGSVAGNGLGDAAVGVYDLEAQQVLGRTSLQGQFNTYTDYYLDAVGIEY